MTAAASACLGIMPGVACASPRAQVYATVDGAWLALSASTQGMTARLFRSLDRPELIEDPRFPTNADRLTMLRNWTPSCRTSCASTRLMPTWSFSQQPQVMVGPVYDAFGFEAFYMAGGGRWLVVNMVEGGRTPILEAHDLAQLGFAMASYPATGFLAADAALEYVYRDLLQHGSSAPTADRLLSFEAMHSLMGFDAVWRRDRELSASTSQ